MIDADYPQVMGILNVTPDSFSDGGCYTDIQQALKHALKMQDEGAAIIDVGGESTRPGAAAVSVDEELQRVIPVIEKLASEADVGISVDTSKPEVMREAVNAGATMVNDVTALRQADALSTVAELAVPVCLMHMLGEPRTMQDNPAYEDGVINGVKKFLQQRIDACRASGIDSKNIIIDPGFGFGKTLEQNYQLLGSLSAFAEPGCKIMVGISRKSMLGNLLGLPTEERLPASLAAAVIALMQGVHILRVHDVKETMQALAVYRACYGFDNGPQASLLRYSQ